MVAVFGIIALAALARGGRAAPFVVPLLFAFVFLLGWVPRLRLQASQLPSIVLAAVGTIIPFCVSSFAYAFGLPPDHAVYLWPLFLPGPILLLHVRHFYLPRFGYIPFFVAYSLAAAVCLFLPAIDEARLLLRSLASAPTLRDLLRLLLLAGPALWAGSCALVAFYLVRRADLHRLHVDLLFSINQDLANSPNLAWTLKKMVSFLRDQLGYYRTFILVPDQFYYEQASTMPPRDRPLTIDGSFFRVAACAGPGADAALRHEFPLTDGVSGRSLREGRLNLVNDVLRDPDYLAFGLTSTRSELNVPVFDRDRPDILLAIVVVHSDRAKAFSAADVEVLERVRDLLALHCRQFRGPASTSGEIERKLVTLSSHQNPQELAAEVMRLGSELFRTPWIAIVPLGVGTGVPLFHRIDSLSSDSFDLELAAETDLFREDALLWRVVTSWEPGFATLDDEDVGMSSVGSGPSREGSFLAWMTRIGLGGLAVLPIGSRDQRVALCLLGFKHLSAGFDHLLRLALGAFARGTSPAFNSAWYQASVYRPFLRPTLDLHRFLTEQGLGRGELERRLKKAAADDVSGVKELLLKVRAVGERVYSAEATERPDLVRVTLREALDSFARDLGNRIDLSARVDDALDEESVELRIVLFRVVTEAALNALTHGRATRISIRIARVRMRVVMIVADNGSGFDPGGLDSRGRHSSGGIVALASDVVRYCGGSPLSWGWTAPGKGTYLRLEIPALPNESLPQDIVRKDWFDHMDEPAL